MNVLVTRRGRSASAFWEVLSTGDANTVQEFDSGPEARAWAMTLRKRWQDTGAYSVRLFCDGRLVSAWRRDSDTGKWTDSTKWTNPRR